MKKFFFATTLTVASFLTASAYGGFIDQGPQSGWKDMGTATYTDGLVCDVFPQVTAGESWAVAVQENTENPGWYRIQPFVEDWPGVDYAGETDKWLTINATNPQKVYMVDTGRLFFVNGYHYVFSQIVPENLEDDTPIYGTLTDNEIKFPANSFRFYHLTPVDSWDPTFTKIVDTSGKLAIKLPVNANVESVIAEEREADETEWFDLRGVRVENPSHGVFIQRSGNKTSKVVLK